MMTNLACRMLLSVAGSAETARRHDKAQSAARARFARGRGDVNFNRAELARLNRDRWGQRVNGQTSKFHGETWAQTAAPTGPVPAFRLQSRQVERCNLGRERTSDRRHRRSKSAGMDGRCNRRPRSPDDPQSEK